MKQRTLISALGLFIALAIANVTPAQAPPAALVHPIPRAPDGPTVYSAVGVPWITGCTAQGGGSPKIPGSATEIAVSPDLGIPWIVDNEGQVSR
jgi:hypothetical protein